MPTTLYKAFQAEIQNKESASGGQRSLWAVASLEEPDREGDVILAGGWELENYRKNPVILFAHKYDQPPVARAVEIGISQKGLRFRAQFPSRNEYPFADTIYQLYRGGYLRSFSVGFIPKLWQDRESISGEGPGGRLFRRQELVEISVVPIPTHPKALVEAQNKGLLGREEIRILEDISASAEKEAEREAIVRLELLLKGVKDLSSQAFLSEEDLEAAVERAMKKSLTFLRRI
ncbi:MAG TPA: HK97 family phage prohead protease [Candidatus Hypogeohydataceae bacterium YC40]